MAALIGIVVLTLVVFLSICGVLHDRVFEAQRQQRRGQALSRVMDGMHYHDGDSMCFGGHGCPDGEVNSDG
jgi:hypothetical protein